MWEFEGQRYGMTRTSYPDEDGLGLELAEARPGDVGFATGDIVARVFHDDPTGRMTLALHRPELSLDLVEWFVSVAREALPPMPQAG